VDEGPVIWDACALLNLVATAREQEILTSLSCPCYVVKEVRVGETSYHRPLPEEDPEGRLVPVDLSPLLGLGLLQDVALTPDEQELFVEYALEIDDGEARTAAVAASRGYRIATDDRPAIRFAGSLDPAPAVLTTPEWLKLWAEATQADEEVLGDVLRRIELCARYHPRRLHPLFDWWSKHVKRR
jgi:hypothetical protein